MGIENLLSENNSNSQNAKKRGPKTTAPKEKQHTFTVRHGVSTKVLLDRIQKLKELTTPGANNISKGDILREALELYATEMSYSKLEKKYIAFMKHINAESVLGK